MNVPIPTYLLDEQGAVLRSAALEHPSCSRIIGQVEKLDTRAKLELLGRLVPGLPNSFGGPLCYAWNARFSNAPILPIDPSFFPDIDELVPTTKIFGIAAGPPITVTFTADAATGFEAEGFVFDIPSPANISLQGVITVDLVYQSKHVGLQGAATTTVSCSFTPIDGNAPIRLVMLPGRQPTNGLTGYHDRASIYNSMPLTAAATTAVITAVATVSGVPAADPITGFVLNGLSNGALEVRSAMRNLLKAGAIAALCR